MPNYQNPYFPYNNNIYGNYVTPQQSYSPQPQVQSPVRAMEWVEGEIGAIAYQMPPGWPANTPIPLWDNKSTTIFLKSWNQMGVPNPLQRIPYTLPEQGSLPDTQHSGATAPDMSQYVTKQDLESLRQELRSMQQNGNRNGNQNGNGNRGGDR